MSGTRGRCVGCGGRGKDVRYRAREMQLGLRELFVYQECDDCGALWLEHPPSDPSRFYPSDYYAFRSCRDPAVRRSLQRFARWACGPTGKLATVVSGRVGGVRAVVRGWPSTETRILDIGCGAGALLWSMWELGYRHLSGADPFLPPATAQQEPFPIRRCTAEEAEGAHDVVILNHVLEHAADPGALLRACTARLRPGGAVLVRVPVVPGAAWRRFGVNWVQLDAPRHVWIPTRDAMARLAASAGLTIASVVQDSSAFQFWGSRLYERDISLHDPRSPIHGGWRALRILPVLLADALRSARANRGGEGDQACFVLRATRILTAGAVPVA